MDRNFEQARDFFLAGVRLYEAGRFAEAEAQFSAALALVPGRPSVLTNRGAALLKLGRPADAFGDLQQALAQEPDNAEALGHAGTALAELGQPREALPLFERAITQRPDAAPLWLLRGTCLRELGRRDEAAAAYREALRLGGDAGLLGFYLAGLEGGEAPAHAPPDYVAALFDGYAGDFDQHLVQALKYDGPRRLLERLAGRHARHALDLGCGTGLCGPWLRRLADRVTGVDLSAGMLARAEATRCYDRLDQADVVGWLQAHEDAADLVVAADVFVYVGALDEVFAQVGRLLAPGGLFCFSLEESEGADLQLRGSLRYAHSEAAIDRLAQAHGFRWQARERAPVREDQGVPIPGLFCWLERAA